MSCSATFSRKHSDKWSKGRSTGGSREKCKPGIGFVLYCPYCPVIQLGGRQMGGMKTEPGTRWRVCKNGHRIEVRNGVRL